MMNVNKPQTKVEEKGLIVLESHHPIIVETLTNLFESDAKREPVDVKICDYDDVEYHIVVAQDDTDTVSLSMKMRCAKELMPMGTKAVLDATFGSAVQDKTEQGYDLTLKWNIPKSHGDSKKIIQNAAEIKRIVMAAPLERCFDALVKGQAASLKPMTIHYRNKESIWVVPLADRVLVAFSFDFLGDTDRAIAAIFLQEFPDVQRAKFQNAPNVAFSKDVPAQIQQIPGFKEEPASIGYFMFTLLKMHLDKPEKIKNAAMLLVSFRTYIHYHVKAAKTYLQSRMRMRQELLLKVLNRANPEAMEAEKGVGRRNTTTQTVKTFKKF